MFIPTGMAKGHEPHYHPETIEVCFITRGHLDWWIDSTPYEVHPGDVLVMMPGQPHGSVDSTLQPCEFYAVHIEKSSLDEMGLLAVSSRTFAGLHPARPEIGKLIQSLLNEHATKDNLCAYASRALTNLLLCELARDSGASVARSQSEFLTNAKETLLACTESRHPVQEAAKRLKVSTIWLTRRFREETGEAPGDWLRSTRIAEAKRLLVMEHLSVTETAIRLGFGSSQYFATAFNRANGITPSEYRARALATIGRLDKPPAVSASV